MINTTKATKDILPIISRLLDASRYALLAISLFSAASSHELPHGVSHHLSQPEDKFALLDPTLHALGITQQDLREICNCFNYMDIGSTVDGMIPNLPTEDTEFLTETSECPTSVVIQSKYFYSGNFPAGLKEEDIEKEAEKFDEKPEILVGSILMVLARVILCDPSEEGWSVVDPKTMEDRIRLLMLLDVNEVYLALAMNASMTVLKNRLELDIKHSLIPILMKIANEFFYNKEVRERSRADYYKPYADRIEANDPRTSVDCLNILRNFADSTVMGFDLVDGNWKKVVLQKKELVIRFIQIAMNNPDFLGMIPHLLDFANKLKPDTDENREIKHVAELIRRLVRRDQKREYIKMVAKSNMHASSDELKKIFDVHIRGYLL